MKKRLFLVLFLILVLIIAVFSTFEIFSRKKPKPLFSQEIPKLQDNTSFQETKDYKDFLEKCSEAGGGVKISSLSKGGGSGGSSSESVKCDCYKLSGDVKESCNNDYECTYNCDFSQAINSGVCLLSKTDKDLNAGTYTYEYVCITQVRGECSSLPLNMKWELQGNKLIETGYREFPLEKEEFSPV